ncbi:ATP-binding cassette domain-containing protein [Janibacter cremeus]|uniref:ABC-type multidrug transport system fused ATPase/permease subunit n=1 Tax=Janibacter cremeus TaxID=1285192 RepID=A0A852VJG1_9MICO|nr:ABC transporter ATP-binding protein [Janibacter cremeus]NYF97247.1 ABC-type multidrug transport system fused ATPase/permease subunit [Janibacter cremeus]
MTQTLTREPEAPAPPPPPASADPSRRIDWRRMSSPWTGAALVCALAAAIALTLGTVIMGRLAEDPTSTLVWVLAACIVGGALLDTVGKIVWVGLSDKAEGRLREDLLDAVLAQPVPVLAEQAVGEILDRIDDDTHEVGNLIRWQVWMFFRAAFAVLPMWIVAGVTWWPAWLLFPLLGGLTAVVIRPLLGEIARRKVVEEIAWTDHASALEEGVAGRDDLRTSLGQAHVVHRLARLSSRVHHELLRVLLVERALARRAGVLLHGLLAAIAVAGVALASRDHLSVAALVTLFLVTATFVGQISMLANNLSDLQEGFGAIIRLRQTLAVHPEPEGGRDLPRQGPVALHFHDLDFSFHEGSFALHGVELTVPAGETMALVGRTGSGKSTLASFVSRAIEPPRGSVLLGGVDVLDLDLQRLRAAVGVVTQRTEVLAGTLAENIAIFGDVPRLQVESAVDELGLHDWVAGLPDGLDTLLGPGGTTLSAGEEQLVAFARLLVRDVRVVVLDEATARMDPVTERRVVAAADRLLSGRTGVLIAHRLTTIERAPHLAVLDHGQVVQQGLRSELALADGPFRELLLASRTSEPSLESPPEQQGEAGQVPPDASDPTGGRRRSEESLAVRDVGDGPSLARGILHALLIKPAWGLFGASLFLLGSLAGAQGAVTGLLWGLIVERLERGDAVGWLTTVLVTGLVLTPLLLAQAFVTYPRWWVEVMLRTRMSVLHGQTVQTRLPRTPPGEVVARSMDADRYARYSDRWIDFVNGLLVTALTALLAGTWVAGAILLVVMVTSALASTAGRPAAGRSAAAASTARARFGRALVSALESMRTVKLAAATSAVQGHLRGVDAGRVAAAVREHRIQAFLQGVPMVMVQCGVVAAWAVYLLGGWGLATALLVASAVAGFEWFGRVAGLVVTEAPGTRHWQVETSRFAGGVDLMDLPAGVDLVSGEAPGPAPVARVPLERLELRGVSGVHEDGTIGVSDVDLTVDAGELVLLVGQVGSGKSSLLAAMAGLVDHRGDVLWNGDPVEEVQTFMRPGQVAHVAQVPRVLSGTFGDNVRLGHERPFEVPIAQARLASDIEEAGGPQALVGHRGVRLSGGQVQRLALARAMATQAELLLADDVSSALDAATEIELWQGLRERGATVIGATSKRAALERADRVVVLVAGRVAAVGPWESLAPRWGHLAG